MTSLRRKAVCLALVLLSTVACLGVCGCESRQEPATTTDRAATSSQTKPNGETRPQMPVDTKVAAPAPDVTFAPGTESHRGTSAVDQSEIIAKLKELGSQVNITNGQVMGFGGPQVTDEALSHLQGLTTLTLLQLTNSKVTDAGLAHLGALSGLQQLFLSNTQITDAGLQHLKNLKGLKVLTLNNTKITDAGLEELRGLTQLQSLNLQSTEITDAGLVHLEGMTNLSRLSVAAGTEVTPEGVNKLKQALPKCEIRN